MSRAKLNAAYDKLRRITFPSHSITDVVPEREQYLSPEDIAEELPACALDGAPPPTAEEVAAMQPFPEHYAGYAAWYKRKRYSNLSLGLARYFTRLTAMEKNK